ncbi:MAG: hypothetical protein LBJ95_01915 [Oscillospiraceae bacterium]|jgi:hypothetical protein|nr:hypothetical protein [Oscillospiraceae bacterium]
MDNLKNSNNVKHKNKARQLAGSARRKFLARVGALLVSTSVLSGLIPGLPICCILTARAFSDDVIQALCNVAGLEFTPDTIIYQPAEDISPEDLATALELVKDAAQDPECQSVKVLLIGEDSYWQLEPTSRFVDSLLDIYSFTRSVDGDKLTLTLTRTQLSAALRQAPVTASKDALAVPTIDLPAWVANWVTKVANGTERFVRINTGGYPNLYKLIVERVRQCENLYTMCTISDPKEVRIYRKDYVEWLTHGDATIDITPQTEGMPHDCIIARFSELTPDGWPKTDDEILASARMAAALLNDGVVDASRISLQYASDWEALVAQMRDLYPGLLLRNTRLPEHCVDFVRLCAYDPTEKTAVADMHPFNRYTGQFYLSASPVKAFKDQLYAAMTLLSSGGLDQIWIMTGSGTHTRTGGTPAKDIIKCLFENWGADGRLTLSDKPSDPLGRDAGTLRFYPIDGPRNPTNAPIVYAKAGNTAWPALSIQPPAPPPPPATKTTKAAQTKPKTPSKAGNTPWSALSLMPPAAAPWQPATKTTNTAQTKTEIPSTAGKTSQTDCSLRKGLPFDSAVVPQHAPPPPPAHFGQYACSSVSIPPQPEAAQLLPPTISVPKITQEKPKRGGFVLNYGKVHPLTYSS